MQLILTFGRWKWDLCISHPQSSADIQKLLWISNKHWLAEQHNDRGWPCVPCHNNKTSLCHNALSGKVTVNLVVISSIKEMPLSAMIFWTFFSLTHFGQFLLKAECLPAQFGHFASLRQSLLLCPAWPQLAQVSLPLQVFLPCPYFWQLKQRRGFGM